MRTKKLFNVKHIFFGTVPPFDSVKKYKNRLLKYKVITAAGDTSDYLFEIFDKAPDDCKVQILFKSNQNQENEIRGLLVSLALSNVIAEKEKCFKSLAKKMYDITDARNGMGLLVLIEGKRGKETRLMLCRFKGAQGLHNEGETLKFLSQVFTKQNNHYKLAVFEDIVSKKSFWKGYAIDRQTAPNNYKPFSQFWIEDFLQAETAITDAQGTSQFSKIIKNIVTSITDIEQKEQIISAVLNLKSKPFAKISIKKFSDTYLSGDLPRLFQEHTSNDEFYHSEFGIDADVFQQELGSTVIVLEDGVTALVPTFSYKKHVTEEKINEAQKKITIEGLLKDKKINVGKKQTENKNVKK